MPLGNFFASTAEAFTSGCTRARHLCISTFGPLDQPAEGKGVSSESVAWTKACTSIDAAASSILQDYSAQAMT